MRAATILMLLLISPTVSAQIYSWRDAEGRMHYSDLPPTGQAGQENARKMAPVPTVPGDTENARRDLANRELEFKKRQQDAALAAAKEAKEKADAAEAQRNCEQAKSYLRALESGARISRTNENGERVFLDDNSRQQETVAAGRAVTAWCK
jgi:hypothetical protein